MKILIASYVVPEIIEALQKDNDVVCKFRLSQEELNELIVDREVVVLRSGVHLNAEAMALAPELKLVIRAGSGLDNVDLDYIQQRELNFARIPEPGARAVAEIAFGFMIALARQFREADIATRDGRWIKTQIEGYLLHEKTLGIVGVGNIGTTVARMGVAWGMKVIGCVERPREGVKSKLHRDNIDLVDLDTVLTQSDFVSLHVPLKASTRNLIGATELAKMKQGAYLINLARGGVVDEQALHDSLVNNHLRGCAVDVHLHEGDGQVSPLAHLPNVLLTPHTGAQTVDTQIEIGKRILGIIKHQVLGQELERYTVAVQTS